MEPELASSDDSCDTEMKIIKNQLTEFGLNEENLSRDEMVDLLKALKNSKTSAKEDELLRQKKESEYTVEPRKLFVSLSHFRVKRLDFRDTRSNLVSCLWLRKEDRSRSYSIVFMPVYYGNYGNMESRAQTIINLLACSESHDAQVEESPNASSPKNNLKRRYINVRDRRMPWSLLPSTLTQAEKARTLAVYIKLMSINSYRQARQSATFATWPPPIQIVEETTRVQPLRSTRSGRSVPIYAGFDDDSTDLDFVITKTKKRKVSNSDKDTDTNDGVYSHKVVSLKRKSTKEEIVRPVKEAKINTETTDFESFALVNNLKPKRNVMTPVIED